MERGREMLHSVGELRHFGIAALDGTHIGRVVDTYFDDERWAIRYLVVDMVHWLVGRRVLISSLAVRGIDRERRVLSTVLTRAQAAESPDFDSEKPVSRQHEVDLSRYYGLPYYLMSDAIESMAIPTAASAPEPLVGEEAKRLREDPHLRSARVVTHYYVHARDRDSGHVADLLYEDGSWRIGYIVVATGSRLRPGRKVLVPVECVEEVVWSTSSVELGVRSETVKLAPEYDPTLRPDREYLARLAGYYGAPVSSIGSREPTPSAATGGIGQ